MKKAKLIQGFHILAKPTGPICNLDCHYCFYTEKESLFSGETKFRMSDETLEKFIRQYIQSQHVQEIPFVWQGGEPTLMGLDFYKRVIELQNKYGEGRKITNSLQTNGTLLTEEWCEFFAEHDFLVGLSLDGPEFIHDRYRVDRGQKPTFHKVLHALHLLKRYKVNFNILVCVTKFTSQYPMEIYQFFKKEGVQFIQFIPIVERTPNQEAVKLQLRHATPPSIEQEEVQQEVSPWTVESEKYGDFLISIFDEWVKKDVGQVYIMNFEQSLTSWLGLPSTVCIFAETCGNAAIIEHNGEVYSCDHFMYPDYHLGNIYQDTFGEMLESNRQRAFGENKKSALPKYCQTCEVRFACNGECPKHRFLLTPDGEPGLNYLCAGYKKYFLHIHRYMKVMVQLIQNGLSVTEVMNVIKGPLVVKR